MKNKDTAGMNTKDELLLSKFIDGECSFIERVRANRVLARSSGAHEFLEGLKFSRSCLKQTLSVVPIDMGGEDSLWRRVSNRIDQEERNLVFLGERASKDRGGLKIKDYFGDIFSSPGIMWGGISGTAVVAAALFTFMSFSHDTANFSDDQFASQKLGSGNEVMTRNVALNGGSRTTSRRPVILERGGLGSAISVDWMRGNGSVRVTEDPHDGGPMIWVTRRSSSANSVRPRRLAPVIKDASSIVSSGTLE